MWGWEQARDVARALSIALAVGWPGLPFGAAAGQPQPSIVTNDTPFPQELSIDPSRVMAWPVALPHLRSTAEPFGLAAADDLTIDASRRRDLAGAIDRDRAILASCRLGLGDCPTAAQQFLTIIEAALAKDGRARLGEVNRALNLSIRYQSDTLRHGVADAWASPLATLSSGSGDCEDYAIAKYLALREVGMPSNDLRLVVVRDFRTQQNHAVLAARFEDRWLVLDSRGFLLLEDRDARAYIPLAGFDPEAEPRLIVAQSRN